VSRKEGKKKLGYIFIGTGRIVCTARSMQQLHVCPIWQPYAAATVGLLLWARRPGDINQLLHGWQSTGYKAKCRLVFLSLIWPLIAPICVQRYIPAKKNLPYCLRYKTPRLLKVKARWANFLSISNTKNHKNRLIFDKVNKKIRRHTISLKHSISIKKLSHCDRTHTHTHTHTHG